ncbi:phosphatase PAP2 family protein [Thioclava sp. GXIMD4215]|uniref:phosphatase PAP2 family protein n=1 Tax=Thioclava sp. GXIMD4215 TaxID=3131928 RepID=UPI0032546104
MRANTYRRTGLWLLIMWTVAVCLFEAFPQIDLWVTALFYTPKLGFTAGWLDPVLEYLRQRIWDLSVLLAVVSLVMVGLCAVLRRPLLRLTLRDWAWIMLSYLIGPVILVNGLFKAYSGRARPAEILPFGGEHLFTRAWQFADQCTSNCSFVSGEGAAVVILSLGLWLVGRRWCGARGQARATGWAWGLSVFVLLQRLVTGRHFLSDLTFAALISLTIAWALWGLLQNGGQRRAELTKAGQEPIRRPSPRA